MPASQFSLEVQARIPDRLTRLPELADNLVYSWDRDLRRLFRYLDNDLYERCYGNPKLFLRRLAQEKIDRAAEDPTFIRNYNQVLSFFDTYHTRQLPADLREHLDPAIDLVAYLCFEFGFHDSLPTYSGGLGILAGDHCKASADLAVPLVAIGLLYHQGYFVQHLDSQGNQIEHYLTTHTDDLPLELVCDADGVPIHVLSPAMGTEIRLHIWRGRIGGTYIFLLDSNLQENPEEFRSVTHRLYGGDQVTRIRQELVLGIGGVRAMRALNLAPTVWHLNEGHSSFQCLERCRELMQQGYSFDTALEIVSAATVFTTHTPVPAGHDAFDTQLLERELGGYLRDMNLELGSLLELGNDGDPHRLNMTALALRTARFHNGVSQVHGQTAAGNDGYVWPEVPADENPIGHITNGVHLPTFLALEWVNLFDIRFSDWRSNLANRPYWERIEEISDHQFHSLRQELKSQLFANIKQRLLHQHLRNGLAETTIERMLEIIDDPQRDVLVLGFARRFATYKRAKLVFSDPDRLTRLLGDEERPVVLLMAGKAHPSDGPGKALIRELYEFSMRPEFIGRFHIVENYDMALARLLAAGVDVWLNTPEFPLEASGTSGIKAAMNGVINLSVLDGWWAEGFDGMNGWGIRPHDRSWNQEYRQHQEAQDLLEILENKVIPLYFDRRESHGWVHMAKASMKTIIPRFNAERMLRDYVVTRYGLAARHSRRLASHRGAEAERLSSWKRRIAKHWDGVSARIASVPPARAHHGDAIELEVEAGLNGLSANDVSVECLVAADGEPNATESKVFLFERAGVPAETDKVWFRLALRPPYSGLQHYRIRMYPFHPLLAHKFEMGRMYWL
jgi:glycogen phosphorylase